MSEPTLKPHWRDMGARKKYHGKCNFVDGPVFDDGYCYECMFYLGKCSYLEEMKR
jgi:hypothetical protein